MTRLRQFIAYLGKVCLEDKFPVWATLVGVILGGVATALGTYFIVPSINQNLERQKIKSEFVIRNLDDLNSRTRSLLSDVSDLHSRVLRIGEPDPDSVQKISAKVTEMQWKAIELGIIFEGTPGSMAVERYQASLETLRSSVSKLQSKTDLQASQQAAENFASNSLAMIRALAEIAGLRVNPSTPKAQNRTSG